MLNISIVCVGRLKELFWRDACAEYAKRMNGLCKFQIIEVEEERLPDNPSQAQIAKALEEEGKRLLNKVVGGTRIIALCVEGREMSSEALSSNLQSIAVSGISSVAFLIGGSWGLSPQVKQAAAQRLSMSPMTFPHQLARVMLCEQIYRAFQIANDGKYHK